MMRRILYSAVIIGLLGSCSKKNDNNTTTEENAYPTELLASIHSLKDTGFDSLLYQNSRLVSYGKGYSYTESSPPFFTETYTNALYNGKVTKASYNYSSGLSVVETITYKDSVILVYGGDIDTTYLYINNNGQIKKAIYTGVVAGTALYNYDGKNLTSYSFDGMIQASTYKVMTTFTYDDHPNPVYGICRFNLHFFPAWKNQFLFPYGGMTNLDMFKAVDSYNNPLTVTITEITNGRTTIFNTVNYSYTYDSISAFPLSQTMTVNETINGSNYTDTNVLTFRYRK